MNSGKTWIWVVILLLITGGMATLFSIPVYKQHRFTELKHDKNLLIKQINEQRENLREVQVEMNKLNSREYIGGFAEEVLGLELVSPPKIAEVN